MLAQGMLLKKFMPYCTYIVSSALQKHQLRLFNIVPAEAGFLSLPT